uniref:Uncharacterized protein n=1 Tax=Anguilla anguilla TaxID=7936 RepID=A0A0E9XR48_ANGAN
MLQLSLFYVVMYYYFQILFFCCVYSVRKDNSCHQLQIQWLIPVSCTQNSSAFFC